MAVDNAYFNWAVLSQPQQDDPVASQQPQSSENQYFFHVMLETQVRLTSPETASLMFVHLSLQERCWTTPRAEFSGELVRDILAQMLLPPHIAEAAAAALASSALQLAASPTHAANPLLPLCLLITATFPYDHDEGGRASSPASGSAVAAALKEVSLQSDIADSSCMICLDELVAHLDGEDAVAVRLPCSHVYHKDCIVRWLESSRLCPLCRCAVTT